MRPPALALALLLLACTDPAPPSATASLPPAPVMSHAATPAAWLWADVAADPAPGGAWSEGWMEGGLHAASYGPDADAPIFQLSCDAHAHTATLIFYGASDEAETTMTLIAPDGRRDLVARSGSVLGRRAIVAHRRADEASIVALAASQDGFAIEAGGEVVRLPGDAMLARVIGACAAP